MRASRISTQKCKSPDDYLNLVRTFPLRTLRSHEEHQEAIRVLGQFARPGNHLTTSERDYAEALVHFIKAYEDASRKPNPKLSAVEMVRFLIEQHGMNTEQLGKILGSQTAASLFLNGKRELSKNQIRRLADHFKLDAGVLFAQTR